MSGSGIAIQKPRKRGSRKLSTKILISGDGPSEKAYFDRFVGVNPAVKVISLSSGKSGFKRILEKTDGYVKENGVDVRRGDRVAIVTDVDDVHDAEDVGWMVRECERRGYELYLSNPCFEVWLLLHFIFSAKGGSAKEFEERVDHQMRTRFDRPYVKSSGIPRDPSLLESAMVNASRLQGDGDGTAEWCRGKNPSTTVHRLVTVIDSRSGPEA